MYYIPFGPFYPQKVKREKGRFWRAEFWGAVEEEEVGLSTANGIYIFSLKWSENFTPWYIGKTCSSKGFRQEVFQDHKIEKSFQTEEERRGRPALHLIAKMEPERGNFCRYSERSDSQIDQLETYLIGMALTVNSKLRNDKKTAFHRNLDVEGVLGPSYRGARREAARSLRKALGL